MTKKCYPVIISEKFFDFETAEYKTVNVLSIAGSSISLLYSLWLRYRKPAYLDRVSLRIQTLIAFNDIIRHIVYLNKVTPKEDVCKLLAFLHFLCYHINTFLNVAIALNLHIVYIRERETSSRYVTYLYLVPILASFVIDSVPFVFDAYGRAHLNTCYLVKPSKNFEAMKILLLYATNYIGLVYCLVIPVVIFFKIKITKPDPNMVVTVQNPLARKLVSRISLYPFVCFICHSGNIVSNIYASAKGAPNSVLFAWCFIGLSINGLMNFICFVLDPYVLESLKENSTWLFEPIKVPQEVPQVIPHAITPAPNRCYIDEEAPSANCVPGSSFSDTSTVSSMEIRTPDFRDTPTNSYAYVEPLHYLSNESEIEQEQVQATFEEAPAPHTIFRTM